MICNLEWTLQLARNHLSLFYWESTFLAINYSKEGCNSFSLGKRAEICSTLILPVLVFIWHSNIGRLFFSFYVYFYMKSVFRLRLWVIEIHTKPQGHKLNWFLFWIGRFCERKKIRIFSGDLWTHRIWVYIRGGGTGGAEGAIAPPISLEIGEIVAFSTPNNYFHIKGRCRTRKWLAPPIF